MENFKRSFLDFMKTFGMSLFCVLIIYTFICRPIRVDGSSMYPTLHDGDLGFGGVITKLSGYDRFDIVILQNDKTKNLIVKRIIGLPNEVVYYRDNELYVNDKLVDEPFLNDSVITEDFEIVLGDDEYLCLGDNREVSRDSRYYGAFNKDDINAKGVFVLMPFSDFGIK